jgi:signal transduction histidine kinase
VKSASDTQEGQIRVGGPAQSDFSEAVERLFQEGRRSPACRLSRRHVTVELGVGMSFVATAAAAAVLLPGGGPFELGLAIAYVAAYAVATRVQFDVGVGYTVPTQLLLVPMLFALPPTLVPLVVAGGLLLGDLPELLTGRRHASRAIQSLGDAWHAVGPAVVLGLAGAFEPDWSDWPIYLAALAAQVTIDLAASTAREWLGRGVAPRVQLGVLGWVYAVDVMLAPVGLLAAFASEGQRYAFLALLPLAGLFVIFARERRARIENALGLSQAYRETSELNARLLETERQARRDREQLIAAASHEMQTPLAVLLGLVDALQTDSLSPQQRSETYETVRRQAVLLRHLVRQFVDYTRLKAGRPLAFHRRPTSIRSIVEEVAEAHGGEAKVELTLPDELPPALIDPDRLHQVIMNLTSNAVKFSPPGERATISASSGPSSLEITVIDRGPGIGPDRLPHLFQESLRLSGENGSPGAGLGLYMARSLTEPQGAHVTVDSSPGAGSRFTVVLPRAS